MNECKSVCMYACMLYLCMYIHFVVHIIVPLRSVLRNGMTMYHGQVSYGRHMWVSRTALADLSFTDCT